MSDGQNESTSQSTLLVIEDDEADREAIARIVGATHRLVTASLLSEAIEALTGSVPDCILLDLDLPDAHGLGALARILEASGPAAPVIVMAGAADECSAQRALDHGAEDYLVKGRDLQLLPRAIRYAVSRHRVVRRLQRHETQLACFSALASGVAHEINNPMMALVGNLDFARDVLGSVASGAEHGEVIEALDDAREAAGRIGRVVRALAQFAHVGHPTRGTVDVCTSVRHGVTLAAPSARHVVLDTALAPVPRVAAHGPYLAQIVCHLVVNAAEALEEGGAIQVTTRCDARGQIEIEVADDGPGIAPAVLTRVFEPFFTTCDDGSRPGLGLSVCLVGVHAIGGSIGCRRGESGGTVFRIVLPAASADPLAQQPLDSQGGAVSG